MENTVKEYGNKVLERAESLQFQGMLSRDYSIKPLMKILDDEVGHINYILSENVEAADINLYFQGRLEEIDWKLERIKERMEDYTGREFKISE